MDGTFVYDSGEKTTVAHEIVTRWITRNQDQSPYKQPNFLQAPWSTKASEGRSLAFAAGEAAWIMKGKALDADFIATPAQIAEVRAILMKEVGGGATHLIERQLRSEPSRAATGLEIGDVLESIVARRFYLSELMIVISNAGMMCTKLRFEMFRAASRTRCLCRDLGRGRRGDALAADSRHR